MWEDEETMVEKKLTINKKLWFLYDFSEDEYIADKLKREVEFEGGKAKIIVRKNAYFEKYPSGEGYTQKVYAVYAMESGEGNE